MQVLKGRSKYWHPKEDPSGISMIATFPTNFQLVVTLAKRLCRGGVLVISVSCIPFYIHVQLAVMLSFHVVQHAQIEKCIPRRFCIKQNNQKKIFLKVPKRDKQSVIQTFERVLAKV
jgi:hypothetical protein